MKDDVISRQAAIEALKICDTNEDGKICHICPMRDERWDGAWEDNETICYKKLMRDSAKLLALPFAQPVAKDINVPVKDCISRQATIAEIMEDLEDRSLHDDPATPEDYAEGYDEGIRNAAATVLQMPSAQPDLIPCDVCRYYPPSPSSMDGKPCTICPAGRKNDE